MPNGTGHLIVERSSQQKLFIGKAGDVLTGPIVVQVIGFKKWNEESKTVARIGIEAQRDVVILRDELTQPTVETIES